MFGKRHIPGKNLAIRWFNGTSVKIQIRKRAKENYSAGKQGFREMVKTVHRIIPPGPLRSASN
jgi:hypothetical protein